MTGTAQAPPRHVVRTVGELIPADREGDALRAPGRAPITYAELRSAVEDIAGGLAALGVEPGDRVAILAATRPEWVLADFGTVCAGATVVPVYHTNSSEECEHVLGHSETRLVFVEDADQAAKVARVRDRLPKLELVVVFDGTAEGAMTLAQLRALGAADGAAVAAERIAAAAAEDPATIVYTSGTTGLPKGCVLTHANLLSVVEASSEQLGMWTAPPVIFLYLPLAHVLARLTALVAIATGGTLVFWSGDRERLAAELAEAAPTYVPTVPRLLEKVHTRVLGSAAGARGVLLHNALAVGERVARRRRAGRPVGWGDRLRHAVLDRLVLAKVRAAFGPRGPVVITGAAPIGVEVLEFFAGCGVTVLEGYGMTETSAASTLNTLSEQRVGSVGRPLPGTEVAIADDGEVLMRGPHVFSGYHRDPEATDAALTDGWMHSGDLGELDADGFLRIVGRKKDLIITSSGKNISPELIESALRETQWISQAVVVGDRRPYLVALITLDPDELARLAEVAGVDADPAALASDQRVRAAVWQDIETVNERLARIEQIKRFAILPRDLTQHDGELTPTLKVKRNVIVDRYAETIDRLYAVGSSAWGERDGA
jgi:long-chain acyl-CoA synthetase